MFEPDNNSAQSVPGSNATQRLIEMALLEDIGDGDITSEATLKQNAMVSAVIVAKATGVIAGIDVARAVFQELDPQIEFDLLMTDGQQVEPGERLILIEGTARTVMTAERTALNFLGRLSGIATATSRYVKAVESTAARILDTRKTTPGLRALEKYAVAVGGGTNHRAGLYDMVLIKENHIRAAGSISLAVESTRALTKERGSPSVAVEVEAATMDDVDQAIDAKCDRIMLDNMSPKEMISAVEFIRGKDETVEIEASGNITLENVLEVAQTGVDLISIGAITHSAPAMDLSMLVTDKD